MRRGFLTNGGERRVKVPAKQSPSIDVPPPPTIPIPAPLTQRRWVSKEEKLAVVTRAEQDNPAFTLRVEHIPGVDGSAHTITASIYTTEEQPPLCERSWKPFARGGRYEIRETEHTGKGMFSLDCHAPGDLVVCERPLVIFPVVDKVGKPEDSAVARTILQMPAATRRLLLALHNCKPHAPSVEYAIAKTNSFEAHRVPGCIGQCSVVFDDISRINHRCAPNAVFGWDPESLSGQIHAVQPIAPGEQIFISYVSNYAMHHERQEALSRIYAFTCTCATCTLPPNERWADDNTRQDASRAAAEAGSPPVVTAASALRVTKTALGLARRMREAGIGQPYSWVAVSRTLVEAACVLGDRARAVRWAMTAAGAMRAATGADGGWEAVAAAPERTEMWLLGQRGERLGGANTVWNGPQFCPTRSAV
ncbi:hypothetical protein FA95DRAFT_1574980 [Auriscalpium vulgare]|uniref:Uncharacterized protein n=1 Tax=Auriscalpium vulgare TaxID=40419 RepID=A0ACB8RHP2_9AGAM|nr:hypothetical protein FA95DRAFT_1574980 [Auriscalpium vulgare]